MEENLKPRLPKSGEVSCACDREAQVSQVLEGVRPAMRADGGDVELISVDGDFVKVRFRGTCLSCPSIELTLRQGIERTLRERLPWVKDVIRVS